MNSNHQKKDIYLPSYKLLAELDQTDAGDSIYFDVNTSVDKLIKSSSNNQSDKKLKNKNNLLTFGSKMQPSTIKADGTKTADYNRQKSMEWNAYNR